MGTGWNLNCSLSTCFTDYNRLGYGYWLEPCRRSHQVGDYYNRLGYGYWLELSHDERAMMLYYNRLGYGYWLEPQ